MWHAEKIEFTENPRDEFEDETDGDFTIEVDGEIIHFKTGSTGLGGDYTLKINGAIITNNLPKEYMLCTRHNFQCVVCDCGTEGCITGGYLLIRKHEASVLFLPAFDVLDSVEEFNQLDNEDISPPKKWYVDGILSIEEPFISELKSLKLIEFNDIPEMTAKEINMMLEWETMVKNNGFTNITIGYSIFLDDILDVDMVYPETNENFYYARSYYDCIKIMEGGELPVFMSFDTDLGNDKNEKPLPDGYAVAKWLVYESGFDLTNFKFNVHSENHVAKEQIENLLNNHIKFISESSTNGLNK